MNFKKLFAPSGDKKELTALENWSVRWTSRYGEFSGHTQAECEFFLSEEEANHFAEQLREAFKLIRHTSLNKVEVKKTK